MSDRELLELAAKAAGYEAQGMEDGKMYLYGIQDGWNPLTDDGDALRLAVKLSIDSDFGLSIHLADLVDRNTVVSKPKVYALEDVDSDPYAATRRAIVRAAAEIGKAMP